MDTAAWLYQRFDAAAKNISDTLQDMAGELPRLFYPSLRREALDVRVTGVMEHAPGGAQVIATGRLTSLSAGVPKESFTRRAKQERREEHPTYRALGSGMPQDVGDDLAANVTDLTISIDIANHFLGAIRRTNAVNAYVGPTPVGIIVPFAAFNTVEGGKIDVAIDRNGRFAEGQLSISRAAEDSSQFILVPKARSGSSTHQGSAE